MSDGIKNTSPGPWAWFGHGGNKNLCLATIHSGRRFVMDFTRWGMQGAQPRFQVNGLMVDGSDLVKFEVGDGMAVGVKQGKEDGSVYRMEINDIAHPDARLIVAAPELLEALDLLLDEVDEPPEANCSCHKSPPCADCVDYGSLRQALAVAESALQKVRGGGS